MQINIPTDPAEISAWSAVFTVIAAAAWKVWLAFHRSARDEKVDRAATSAELGLIGGMHTEIERLYKRTEDLSKVLDAEIDRRKEAEKQAADLALENIKLVERVHQLESAFNPGGAPDA